MQNPFLIEEHFKQFVSVSYKGIKPEDLHPMQMKVAKEAFFAAWGQCLLWLRDDLSTLPESKSIPVLEDMTKQVTDFFLKQASRNQ